MTSLTPAGGRAPRHGEADPTGEMFDGQVLWQAQGSAAILDRDPAITTVEVTDLAARAAGRPFQSPRGPRL